MTNNVFVGTSSTWTTTSNWSLGSAPAAGQAVFLTNSNTSLTAGLDNHTTSIASLNIVMDFTGAAGATGVTNTYLQIVAPVATIGLPAAGGSASAGPSLFNWDAGTTGTSITILNTRNTSMPVRLLGSALTLTLTGGIVGVAVLPSETATINTMSVVSSGQGGSPQAFIGPGCTLGTLTLSSGSVMSYSQQVVTSAVLAGAGCSLTHDGSGGFTSLNVGAGAVVSYTGTGTVGSLSLTGTFDLSSGGGTVTFTNVTLYKGFVFRDPLGRAIFTNPPTLVNCSRKDGVMDLGIGRYT